MSPLQLSALLVLALLTGNEFCVAAFVEPILRRLSPDHEVAAVPHFASRLGAAMPGWYALSLVLTAAATWANWKRTAVLLSGPAVALLLQVCVLVVTLALLVPRNNRLARMTGPYEGLRDDASQWDRLHQLRVLLLFVATIALAV